MPICTESVLYYSNVLQGALIWRITQTFDILALLSQEMLPKKGVKIVKTETRKPKAKEFN